MVKVSVHKLEESSFRKEQQLPMMREEQWRRRGPDLVYHSAKLHGTHLVSMHCHLVPLPQNINSPAKANPRVYLPKHTTNSVSIAHLELKQMLKYVFL